MTSQNAAFYIQCPADIRPTKNINSLLMIRQQLRNDMNALHKIVRITVFVSLAIEAIFMLAAGWIGIVANPVAGLCTWLVGLVLGSVLQCFCAALTHIYKQVHQHLNQLNHVQEVN